VRRVSLWLTATIAIVVLLFTYHTSTTGRTAQTVAVGTAAPGVVTTQGTDPTATTDPTSTPSTGTGTSSKVKANGSVADTRWGPVQVQVTISSGKITDVQALIYPNGNGRDEEINAYALPQLRQQVLTAQSGDIQGVSGATVTSDGYRESLQAALSAAHFTG
jgi:uncharacterized protein with FMN-binding domain